jgi:hypothetical protein
MDRPEEEKGAVFIRSFFWEVSQNYFPRLTHEAMVNNEDWREAIQAEGGPFCYTPAERRMPF